MFEPVPAEQLSRLLPLFAFDYPNRTMLVSFLEGRSPGLAVVDNLDQPTAAIVSVNFSNFTFVGGAPNADWLAETFRELRQQRYLVIADAAWLTHTAGILPMPDATISRLEFLHPQPERQQQPIALPNGFDFRPMDADLLKRCLWLDQMEAGYGSAERMLAEGFGICLMHGDEICCETYALFPAEGHYEIGVVTHDEYQGKGLGYATCAKLADECARHGYQTSWSCHQSNPASAATARKLGYATEREYQFIYYAQAT